MGRPVILRVAALLTGALACAAWVACAEISGLSNLTVDAAAATDAVPDTAVFNDASHVSDGGSDALDASAAWCQDAFSAAPPGTNVIDFCADFDEGALNKGFIPQGATTWTELKLASAASVDTTTALSPPGSMKLAMGATGSIDVFQYQLGQGTTGQGTVYGVDLQLQVGVGASGAGFAGVALGGTLQGYNVMMTVSAGAATFELSIVTTRQGMTSAPYVTGLTGVLGEWNEVSLAVDVTLLPKVRATVTLTGPNTPPTNASMLITDDPDAVDKVQAGAGALGGTGTLHVDNVLLFHQ